MWTLPRFILLILMCSTYYQNLPWGNCQASSGSEGASKESERMRFLQTQSSINKISSLVTLNQNGDQIRNRRHSGLNQVLTITVENRLVDGLKEAIDRYLNERRNQGSPDIPTAPHYDYHYDYDDESSSDAAWDLFNPMMSSGSARINTPLQCLVKRCSLGLFSISGQTALSDRVDVIIMTMMTSWYLSTVQSL